MMFLAFERVPGKITTAIYNKEKSLTTLKTKSDTLQCTKEKRMKISATEYSIDTDALKLIEIEQDES